VIFFLESSDFSGGLEKTWLIGAWFCLLVWSQWQPVATRVPQAHAQAQSSVNDLILNNI
jgi:hypothetical protein